MEIGILEMGIDLDSGDRRQLCTEGWHFGCDICQEVCPFNQQRESQPLRATTIKDSDFLAKSPWPTLEEARNMNEQEWDQFTAGNPIRRAKFEGFRRNVK